MVGARWLGLPARTREAQRSDIEPGLLHSAVRMEVEVQAAAVGTTGFPSQGHTLPLGLERETSRSQVMAGRTKHKKAPRFPMGLFCVNCCSQSRTASEFAQFALLACRFRAVEAAPATAIATRASPAGSGTLPGPGGGEDVVAETENSLK